MDRRLVGTRRRPPVPLRAHDGGVRRVRRARRSPTRTCPRPHRIDRRARPHDLRPRLRQRHLRRRRAARQLQPTRSLHLGRGRRRRRRDRAHRRPRWLPFQRALPVGLGTGRQHTVSAMEAVHLRRRRTRSVRHRGTGDRRAGRDPPPVRARDRRDAHRARPVRHRAAQPRSAASRRCRSTVSACARCSTMPTRARCIPASTTSAGAAARCMPTVGKR